MPQMVFVLKVQVIVQGVLSQRLQDAQRVVEHTEGVDQCWQSALPHAHTNILSKARTEERNPVAESYQLFGT